MSANAISSALSAGRGRSGSERRTVGQQHRRPRPLFIALGAMRARGPRHHRSVPGLLLLLRSSVPASGRLTVQTSNCGVRFRGRALMTRGPRRPDVAHPRLWPP
ncbi:hypothetical protein Mp_2g25590 [Marchantia polymorpha subsp. ruderalis]|uniref:Uncharacterized protein n=1 Tax=Marchantia polymorpha TaxID=3197 RepID=A0A2R6XBE9_MARPO|nr:hypothetical protein MARPO_0025s0120 [Marchantia polymorpha]BBN03695.1 hypothetical protein Mp_2g25590 [Marchantia polymorpha subsp. ruderalis]|eukprot:PTQ43438.1 hypothetical protein MARPO_0025s0120 [Marchantia polymorpha]